MAQSIRAFVVIFVDGRHDREQKNVVHRVTRVIERIGGKFFADCPEIQASPEAEDPDLERRFWELDNTLTSSSSKKP